MPYVDDSNEFLNPVPLPPGSKIRTWTGVIIGLVLFALLIGGAAEIARARINSVYASPAISFQNKITANQKYQITGRVVSRKGEVVRNARITVSNPTTGFQISRNTRGAFSIEVPPGKYEVTIKGDGYRDETYRNISVPRDINREHILVFRNPDPPMPGPFNFRFNVRTENGAPAVSARVDISNNSRQLVETIYTDSNGSGSLALPQDSYNVRISGANLVSKSESGINITSNSTRNFIVSPFVSPTVEPTVQPSPKVDPTPKDPIPSPTPALTPDPKPTDDSLKFNFVVKDGLGNAVEGVVVTLAKPSGGVRSNVTTDAEGSGVFLVEPGTYDVALAHDKLGSKTYKDVEISSNMAREFTLGASGDISGGPIGTPSPSPAASPFWPMIIGDLPYLTYFAIGALFLGAMIWGLFYSLSTAGVGAMGKVSVIEDEVHCTLFSPAEGRAGDGFIVQIFAHLLEQAGELDQIAEETDDELRKQAARKLSNMVARGSELGFELQIAGLQDYVDEPVQMHTWEGEIVEVPFIVDIPHGFSSGVKRGKVIVSQNGVPIGRLMFKINVIGADLSAVGPLEDDHKEEMKRYKKAFISYSSRDRAKVIRRVQMLDAAGISYFHDVLSLNPGQRWENQLYKHIDECDVVFLFWSKAASESEWIQKEVMYAEDRRKADNDILPDIIPIIIEGPPPAPAPEVLNFLHFNDKFAYMIAAVDIETDTITGRKSQPE